MFFIIRGFVNNDISGSRPLTFVILIICKLTNFKLINNNP